MTALHVFLMSRRAALAGTAGLCALLLVVIATPLVLAFQNQSSDIGQAKDQLSLARGDVATLPKVRARLADLKSKFTSFDGFVHAANASLAQAQVQNDVKLVVKANMGTIRSAQATPVEPQNGLDRIAVQFDATIPMSRLRDLIYEMETRRPFLFISDIQVTGSRDVQSDQTDPDLEVRWTVQAYRSGGGS